VFKIKKAILITYLIFCVMQTSTNGHVSKMVCFSLTPAFND